MKTQVVRKNNIIYQKSNLFDSVAQIIEHNDVAPSIITPHVCNNVNAFGSGFAASLTDRFPLVKENFHLLGKKATLGNVQHVSVMSNKKYHRQFIISNMIAQNGLISKTNKRPLNYGALCYCMYAVKAFIKEFKKNTEYQDVEIHAPKFGSGLSGGDWKIIEALITDIWLPEINVFIYIPTTLSLSEKNK